MIRIVLADDHQLVRAGFRAILEQRPDLEIIGEASNGHELLDLVRDTRPDVAIVDITMPSLNGIDATARLKREYPDTKVVIVSAHSEVAVAMRALKVGAQAYVVKNSTSSELSAALDSIMKDEVYLSPSISTQIVDSALTGKDLTSAVDERLTARQREVLQLVAEGCTSKEIGERLSLSIRTVDAHRRHIMSVLDIHEVAGLVRYAIREGLIEA
ncbi:response regulator transcription factor [Rhodothermus sp. AH-315-K08]|nr:response regulator transcription factor [Rhodothermus sp. AH-315-K08]